MLFARLFLVALSSTLFSLVAGLSIIAPGGTDLWWVANSDNNLVWDCTDTTYSQFNVVVANPNVNVLTAPLTIYATLQNYVCSKLIPAAQIVALPAASNYTIMLTNILNTTDIYATSQPFEIKPVGSSYPSSTSTPSAGGSSGSPSSTGTSSHPSGTNTSSTSSNSGGSKNALSALGAFAAIVVGVMTA